MSKLIDRLRRLRPSSPIGFRTGVMPKEPSLLLIAASPHPFPVQDIADALLIEEKGRPIEQIIPPAELTGELPWGVAWKGSDIKGVDYLQRQGCDFLVLDTVAPTTILGEGIGKLLTLDPSLSEGLIRAINQLPIDGVVLPLEIPSLSLHHLLLCQHWVSLLRKPVIVLVSPELNIEQLRYIGEAGVKGVIVKGGREELKEWKNRLSSLPTPKEPADIILPRPPQPLGEGEEEELV